MSALSWHHFIDIESLSSDTIQQLLEKAKTYINTENMSIQPNHECLHKVVCLAFFEPSTRTRMTFELAAKHLGATTIAFDAGSSAIKKGETLKDTVETLLAMGVHALVVRDKQEGLPIEMAAQAGDRACIINAGDGCRAHPSQALLDMMTIQHYKNTFDNLSIAICGDIQHSRVARSQILALQKLGVKDIRCVAPAGFLPKDKNDAVASAGVNMETDPTVGLKDADVIITLRTQKERMQEIDCPDDQQFFKEYGLTQARLSLAKPDAIVMHPGPMNRGIEISGEVADGPQSVILPQIRFGIALRMAIFSHCLG